jgi:hypothetical protein
MNNSGLIKPPNKEIGMANKEKFNGTILLSIKIEALI